MWTQQAACHSLLIICIASCCLKVDHPAYGETPWNFYRILSCHRQGWLVPPVCFVITWIGSELFQGSLPIQTQR
ncbi:hypothetical protein BGZ60DRAFT_407812 [Tricladium varicosporioides]|nr:hypothetical protein BGZ60DRAFT_407812 [Hymenoscyphus varicosporioides]